MVWADGSHERVEVILLAIGYRPDLPYLAELGALDDRGVPRQRPGVFTTHPRLGYLGLKWQRAAASNSLRGVGRDARYQARRW
ncbi:hypothetical protein Acor_74560 [Acrocarpospora corrugata]|uniref:Uncharacterized protein n=1 Tax=Acrocarpospora corrugata TaxID=35763 RepID=A0A5M3WG67_9ACTN|nr:hypothetical protein Acor_74560 [Acrocarpospora corrugata]